MTGEEINDPLLTIVIPKVDGNVAIFVHRMIINESVDTICV